MTATKRTTTTTRRRRRCNNNNNNPSSTTSNVPVVFTVIITTISFVIIMAMAMATIAKRFPVVQSFYIVVGGSRREAHSYFHPRSRSRSTTTTTTTARRSFFSSSRRISSSSSPSSISRSTSASAWRPTRLGLVPSAEEFLEERRRRNSKNGSSNGTICLSYLTDVEGDKFYLDRYVEASKILRFVEDSNVEDEDKEDDDDDDQMLPYDFPYRHKIDFVDENSLLVFGGDLWDKGGYDLYVTRQLLDLKRRYPSRVLWVLGNRDINKLRILQELGLPTLPNQSSSEQQLQQQQRQPPPPHHPGLTWFRGSGRIGDPDGELPSENLGERLKWMLSNTMGSPNAFEHRRNELDWERRGCPENNDDRPDSVQISDMDVVQSYQLSCRPTGEMGLFLQQAYLAARIGPVLIVHGSLPLTQDVMDNAQEKSQSVWDSSNLSTFLPWLSTEESNNIKLDSIEEWIDRLNQFCHDNLDQWQDYVGKLEREEIEPLDPKDAIWAYRAGYNNGPPGSSLIQYGMGRLPNGEKNPGVIYNSFTPEGWPASFAEQSQLADCTREFFERSCVQLILTGHKPQGDAPSPIRIDDQSWVICADTSYSGDINWWHGNGRDGDDKNDDENSSSKRRTNLGRGNSVSFRGDVCVSEVLVSLDDYGNSLQSVKYHGVLSDGHEYESLNLLDPACQNMTIGQVAPENMVPSELDSPHQGRWWTKSIFSDGSHLFHAGEGFNVWNFMRSVD
mmetsp:Transcript_6415/g.16298  ORF Transcript_6415/g.16298 Transcript_6415/m.16298 type:complete len:731 (+) Transcript_6415:136-2328(+)